MDASSSRLNSGAIRQFVKETVRRFEVSSTLVRIGVVTYSYSPKLLVGFGRSYSRPQIYRLVDRMQVKGYGGRYLGKALDYTRRYLFSGTPRCGRRRVLVVLTTGESRDGVRPYALKMFGSGVEVYAIGIGRVRRQSLFQIATRHRLAFRVNAGRLIYLTRKIKDRICSYPGACLGDVDKLSHLFQIDKSIFVFVAFLFTCCSFSSTYQVELFQILNNIISSPSAIRLFLIFFCNLITLGKNCCLSSLNNLRISTTL